MIVRAHAKVNLTLEILYRRPDGYHELRSVMRALALHDTVSVECASAIEVLCDVEELAGTANLAYRAADLMREATASRLGARIVIQKAIPVAAGLGGGSSDAAAVLGALNQLWETGLDSQALAGLAARLGSDVPYFLLGGTALAAGRGEQLRPLPAQGDCTVVLVNPGFAVSTPAVYRAVTPSHYTTGEASSRFEALPPGSPPACWPLTNTLQSVTTELFPTVASVLDHLRRWGAEQVLMCGSGPTCFGLFDNGPAGERVAQAATALGWQSWVTHFA